MGGILGLQKVPFVGSKFIEPNVLYFVFTCSLMNVWSPNFSSYISPLALPQLRRWRKWICRRAGNGGGSYTLREPIKVFGWGEGEVALPSLLLLLFCRRARVQYPSPSGSTTTVLEIWEVSGRAKSDTGDPVESEPRRSIYVMAAAFFHQRYLWMPVRSRGFYWERSCLRRHGMFARLFP